MDKSCDKCKQISAVMALILLQMHMNAFKYNASHYEIKIKTLKYEPIVRHWTNLYQRGSWMLCPYKYFPL